jgi:uncharacterized BrkB/YihY/UPF0761 family membrane protein
MTGAHRRSPRHKLTSDPIVVAAIITAVAAIISAIIMGVCTVVAAEVTTYGQPSHAAQSHRLTNGNRRQIELTR